VNILVPALFLATERLLREQSAGNVTLSVAVTFLCIVGGMPESAFLVLAFGCAYFLFRLGRGSAYARRAFTQLKYFLFVQGLGLALAAFLLIPFFEFMKLSFDSHQPANLHGLIVGLRHDAFGLSLFTYVIPTLFGPAWSPIGPGLGRIRQSAGFHGSGAGLVCSRGGGRLIRRPENRFLASGASRFSSSHPL
jgi:hypothetical protein